MRAGLVIVAPFNNQIGSEKYAQPCYRHDRRRRPRRDAGSRPGPADRGRSEEHTSELQSLMRISYAVFCLKKKKKRYHTTTIIQTTVLYYTNNTEELTTQHATVSDNQ